MKVKNFKEAHHGLGYKLSNSSHLKKCDASDNIRKDKRELCSFYSENTRTIVLSAKLYRA